MTVLETDSAAETAAVGKSLGALLAAGDFIALFGELGSGKTCFSGGIAAGLGVDPAIPVTSPTYTLMNIYYGRLELYHFDLYRIGESADIIELGFEDYFYGSGVSLVEWAERLSSEIPGEYLGVSFRRREGDVRLLEFDPHGERYHELVRQLLSE